MKNIGMLELRGESAIYAGEMRVAIDDVLENHAYINGPQVAELEIEIARRAGTTCAIAVSSGTDALLSTLMALGIGPGDEVVLPAFSFFATAGVVARLGAVPVFADIDPQTFNIDPQRVEAAVTGRTRAIIAVHVFGQCAEMDALRRIADKSGVALVEDAAQAIDATYKGRRVGGLGDAACLSFYPTKNLGGIGEGGMVLTNDEGFADLVRRLRNHGESERYVHDRVGGNFRLDTIKAAALLVKLRYLNEFTEHRRRNAARYDELLAGSAVATPHVDEHNKAVYHQYSVLCGRRDELRSFLAERGVATGVYYPIALHLQKCFASLGYRPGSLPLAERTCSEILSLPCHPMLSDDDLAYVASCVQEFGDAATSAEQRRGGVPSTRQTV